MKIEDLLKDKINEGMTLEDLLEMDVDIDDGSEELEKYKNLLSKANGEASKFKKLLKELQTEEQIKEAERRQADEELRSNYEALLKETTISKHKATLLELGFEGKQASLLSAAIYDGNAEEIFKNLKEHNTGLEKKLTEKLLNQTAKPKGAGEDVKFTLDDLKKMSPIERFKFSEENPDIYKELYGG